MTEQEEREQLAAWGPVLDDIGALIDGAMARSNNTEGMTHDPKIVSIFLMRRLRGHRNAFATLTNANLHLDAEIVLRAAIEVAIYLGNLNARREAFVEDLRSDAARTLKGQLPLWFDTDPEFSEEAADGFNLLFGATRADGGKHTPFKWSSLAAQAAMPELYRWYKHLSGTSVHVTGLSVFMNDYLDDRVMELRRLRRVQGLALICGAAVIGSRANLAIMGYDDLDAGAADLMVRMAAVG